MQVGYATGTTHGITIEGNWIGTDVTGKVNLGNAVQRDRRAGPTAAVGGIGPGEGNSSRSTGGRESGSTTHFRHDQNPIRGNSIYATNGNAWASTSESISERPERA